MISKLSLRWGTYTNSTSASTDPLNSNELPLLVPDFHVLCHEDRQVRHRGVDEFAGRKAAQENLKIRPCS